MSEIFTKEAFNQPIEVMRPSKASCIPGDTSVAEALDLMLKKKIGSVLVMDPSGKLSGIFTERDLLKRVGNTPELLEKIPIKNVMTSSPLALSSQAPVSQAFELIIKKHIRHIPIFLDGSLTSESMVMISARDIMQFIVECFPDSVAALGTTTIDEIMVDDVHDDALMQELQDAENKYLTGGVFALPLAKVIASPPLFLSPTTSIDIVYERMISEKVESVLVVEYGTQLVGILTERDFMNRVIGRKMWGKGVPVMQVMSGKPISLLARHKIAYGINNMFKYNHRHVVLVDEEKCPVGCISLLEILHFIYHRIYARNA